MISFIQPSIQENLYSWETECIKRFCEANHISFKLSFNKPAYGCRDAASKRFNGSSTGIALQRELKTLLCAGKSNSKNFLFAAHMSAARSAHFKNIKKALGLNKSCDVKLAGESELCMLGMRLGTVNPFSLAIKTRQNIIQIFDNDLINFKTTMFTNAGTLTAGIEFDVRALIKCIKSARIFNITKVRNEVFI